MAPTQRRSDDVRTRWLNEQSSELDLSKCSLQHLPGWVRDCGSRIEVLRIGGNYLKALPDWLPELSQLAELDVSSNALVAEAAFPALARMRNLKVLNLGRNYRLTMPDSYQGLRSLVALNLVDCRVASIPPWLRDLPKLQRLALGGLTNRSIDFDSIPRLLSHLRAVSMPLQRLPPAILAMDHLTSLDLSGSELVTLGQGTGLAVVERLNVSRNSLDSLEGLELRSLQHLNIQGNKFTDLDSVFEAAPNLVSLIASGNMIATIPDAINACGHLERVQLSHNRIAAVMNHGISRCLSVREVDLSFNLMSEWPTAIGTLPDLEYFGFGHNMVRDAPDDALTFLKAMAEPRLNVREAKLVFVGDGLVGKSTLLAALCDEPFDPLRETTHGLETRFLPLNNSQGNAAGAYRCWDFGGQVQYRSSHQVFFTESAVYLLLWRPRPGSVENNLEHWAEQVRQRAGDAARLVVVGTHRDVDDNPPILDSRLLTEKYGIVAYFHVGSESGVGLDELRDYLLSILETGFCSHEVPASWVAFREHLLETAAPYLRLAEVVAMAKAVRIGQAACIQLLLLGHRLGWWIYYNDSALLSDVVVLKADWLSKAIGRVFDHPASYEAAGVVTRAQLMDLWADLATRGALGGNDVRDQFVELMCRFDMAFQAPARPGVDGRYILPELLPQRPPDSLQAWRAGAPGELADSRYCRMVLASSGDVSVPTVFMPRFIARTHWFASTMAPPERWRDGVVFRDRESHALVSRATDGILIQAYGVDPSRVASNLATQASDLIDDYWPGVVLSVWLPCPRCEYVRAFEQSGLLERVRRRIRDAECSHCYSRIPIPQVLNKLASQQDVAFASLVDELRRLQELVERNVTETRTVGSDVRDGLAAMHAFIRRDLQNLLAGFRDEALNGPRLYTISLVPRSVSHMNVTHVAVRLELYCEHSNLPLAVLDDDLESGVYEFEIPRALWLKVRPWASRIGKLLRLVAPLDLEALFPGGEDFGLLKELAKDAGDAVKELTEGADDDYVVHESGSDLVARSGGELRRIQSLLRERDPGFSDLRLVHNGRRHIWVHRSFESLYPSSV
jgi:Leucine-rich repeat (LRR) protein/GTPase SAR1 family protein